LAFLCWKILNLERWPGTYSVLHTPTPYCDSILRLHTPQGRLIRDLNTCTSPTPRSTNGVYSVQTAVFLFPVPNHHPPLNQSRPSTLDSRLSTLPTLQLHTSNYFPLPLLAFSSSALPFILYCGVYPPHRASPLQRDSPQACRPVPFHQAIEYQPLSFPPSLLFKVTS
jgi:hypothetical protein